MKAYALAMILDVTLSALSTLTSLAFFVFTGAPIFAATTLITCALFVYLCKMISNE